MGNKGKIVKDSSFVQAINNMAANIEEDKQETLHVVVTAEDGGVVVDSYTENMTLCLETREKGQFAVLFNGEIMKLFEMLSRATQKLLTKMDE